MSLADAEQSIVANIEEEKQIEVQVSTEEINLNIDKILENH